MLVLGSFLFLGLLVCGYDFYSSSAGCPDSDLIRPCTCSFNHNGATTNCAGFTAVEELEAIFKRVPGWKMENLNLMDSSMLYVPSSIFSMSSITEISIINSNFVSLFDQPPVSDTLREVNIFMVNSQRGIQWNVFSRLKMLETLAIQEVPISSLDNAFGDAVPKSLKGLFLHKTNLTDIGAKSLSKLDNLETVMIRHGAVKSLDGVMFPKNIQDIDFSYHQIGHLSDGIFRNLPKLKQVSLFNNSIETIQKVVFLELLEQVFVGMEGNPINCDCRIKWLVTSGIESFRYPGGSCTSPKSLEGKKIQDLTISDFDYCLK